MKFFKILSIKILRIDFNNNPEKRFMSSNIFQYKKRYTFRRLIRILILIIDF